MADLNTDIKLILKDLEENLKNKQDFEYVKLKILNLYSLFIEEIDKKEETMNKKIKILTQTQNTVEQKLKYLENHLNNIEKDLYIEDEEDSDFSITCPYCNNEFVVSNDDLTDEIECPECNNIIELDWGEDEGCNGCKGNCNHCNNDDDDDM
jgi:ribosomal protein S27E